MSVTIETLEARSLFSATDVSAVSADYFTVTSDAAVLKAAATAAFATYKAEVKTIAADIKALPKSKTNTAAVAKLTKTTTAAGALDVRDAAKVYSVGKAALNKARLAFLAVVNHPAVAANQTKLNAALASLETILAVPEAKLAADVPAGSTNIAAALSVLVAANPSDTQLSADVSSAESVYAGTVATLTTDVSTLNADLQTLINDIG